MSPEGFHHAPKIPLLDREESWITRAVCTEYDPETFFRFATAEAKAICASCPVIEECREWALSIPSQGGVCGGLSAFDRARIRRKRQRAARECLRAAEAASRTDEDQEEEAS